jgi:hypothetical protein
MAFHPEKNTPVAQLISSNMFICQLFSSKMMYFALLRFIWDGLWHNPAGFSPKGAMGR